MPAAMSPIPRLKPYQGPALFSYGFRPFFFFGACYAALAIGVWLPLFEGEIAVSTLFASRDWHIHEMLFGYVPAIVTGFLLTAIPNWTGRLPLQGIPLRILVIAWIAGRGAVAFSTKIGWLPTALIDVGFLVLVLAAAAREIIAGRNWRNLKVLIPVTVLALANAGFHFEAHAFGVADVAGRIGVSAILVLLMLIGGRIIPSFTRNWLARENPGRLPIPFENSKAWSLGSARRRFAFGLSHLTVRCLGWHCLWQAFSSRSVLHVGPVTGLSANGWCWFCTSPMRSSL